MDPQIPRPNRQPAEKNAWCDVSPGAANELLVEDVRTREFLPEVS
jgi:hypothetical protein